MAQTLMALTDDDTGVWVVNTEISSYEVNLDARTVLRATGLASNTMRRACTPSGY